jgi:hypothetical protein
MPIDPGTQAKPSTTDQDSENQDRNIKLREAVSNAYSRILGEQVSKSFAAFTFEEAMDAQIARIEVNVTKLRPCLLDRVDQIQNALTDAITQIKAAPPESFIEHDPKTSVNTSENPDDDE